MIHKKKKSNCPSKKAMSYLEQRKIRGTKSEIPVNKAPRSDRKAPEWTKIHDNVIMNGTTKLRIVVYKG